MVRVKGLAMCSDTYMGFAFRVSSKSLRWSYAAVGTSCFATAQRCEEEVTTYDHVPDDPKVPDDPGAYPPSWAVLAARALE